MVSDFRLERHGLTADATKDLPSACGESARKIRGSESPKVDR